MGGGGNFLYILSGLALACGSGLGGLGYVCEFRVEVISCALVWGCDMNDEYIL